MEKILEVKDLRVRFPVFGGVFLRKLAEVKAVDGMSFDLFKGETLGLVGESGCGKSTVGRAIVNILHAMNYGVEISGQVLYHDSGQTVDLSQLSRSQMAPLSFCHPDDFPGSLFFAQPPHDSRPDRGGTSQNPWQLLQE